MADIALGQSITGTFTSASSKDANGNYFAEYNLTGLDDFRQFTLNANRLNTNSTLNFTTVDLLNSATGARIDENIISFTDLLSPILNTTYPGINYKVRIFSKILGDYSISTVDGGKATSILTIGGQFTGSSRLGGVGTVGTSGKFFTLAGGSVSEVALAPNGQFYGVGTSSTSSGFVNNLKIIDPSLDLNSQISLITPNTYQIKDIQGNLLNGIRAIEFTPDNKLYATAYGSIATGSGNLNANKLYQIDPTTRVATLVGTLPNGFNGFAGSAGDIVYDAANSRFLATSVDTTTTDALWQIPLSNPAGATKIGQIGVLGVGGLVFEGSQLIGFNNNDANNTHNKISINPTTGVGTQTQTLSGVNLIFGATTIPTTSTTLTSITDFKKDPTKYMGSIRDYDGNKLGGDSSWKLLGDVDIQGDGDLESILVNPAIGRFASVGSVNGNVDFSKYGLNGDTRVVGIYIDPTLKNSPQNIGGPFDSQRRFQNDMQKDNLKLLAAGDYNKDGFQDLYFKLGDGTAVLRALMFKDGNIQYANYQSKSDLTAFMTANNVDSAVWGSWI
jgi:hypothetical protein